MKNLLNYWHLVGLITYFIKKCRDGNDFSEVISDLRQNQTLSTTLYFSSCSHGYIIPMFQRYTLRFKKNVWKWVQQLTMYQKSGEWVWVGWVSIKIHPWEGRENEQLSIKKFQILTMTQLPKLRCWSSEQKFKMLSSAVCCHQGPHQRQIWNGKQREEVN